MIQQERYQYRLSSRVVRPFCTLFLCSWLAFQAPGAVEFQQEPAARLNIVILEGDGAINNIKQRTAREPIVQVEDENHKPIAGAAVIFALPSSGPGATFAQGARTATLFTDQNGRVAARGLRVNRINGKFQMRVTASSQGRTGTAVITQTNVAAATTGVIAGSVTLKVILAVVAAAGIAGGTYAATHSGSSSSATGITIGSPTVGAPK